MLSLHSCRGLFPRLNGFALGLLALSFILGPTALTHADVQLKQNAGQPLSVQSAPIPLAASCVPLDLDALPGGTILTQVGDVTFQVESGTAGQVILYPTDSNWPESDLNQMNAGNVIVFPDPFQDANGDGLADPVGDNSAGGRLRITFGTPRLIRTVAFGDDDNGGRAKVQLFGPDGKLQEFTSPRSPSGSASVDVNIPNVTSMIWETTTTSTLDFSAECLPPAVPTNTPSAVPTNTPTVLIGGATPVIPPTNPPAAVPTNTPVLVPNAVPLKSGAFVFVQGVNCTVQGTSLDAFTESFVCSTGTPPTTLPSMANRIYLPPNGGVTIQGNGCTLSVQKVNANIYYLECSAAVAPTNTPIVLVGGATGVAPTGTPLVPPTATPTDKPTAALTAPPTDKPTAALTAPPTDKPTATPTNTLTNTPTETPTDTPTLAPTADAAARLKDYITRVIARTNQYRQQNGCTVPLVENTLLNRAAQKHAEWMAAHSTLSFYEPPPGNNNPLDQRMRAEGYPPDSGYGENNGAGHSKPEETVDAWYSQPGPRQGMLKCSDRAVGVGYAENLADPKGLRYYWTLDLGVDPTGNIGNTPRPSTLTQAQIDAVIARINYYRKNEKGDSCPQLVNDAKLNQVAQGHADDMATHWSLYQNNDVHTGSDGSTPISRIQSVYPGVVGGENVNFGNSDQLSSPTGVVDNWVTMDEAHHLMMTNCSWTKAGVGYRFRNNPDWPVNWQNFWTLDLTP